MDRTATGTRFLTSTAGIDQFLDVGAGLPIAEHFCDPQDDGPGSRLARFLEDVFARGAMGSGYFRTRAEIEALFTGLERPARRRAAARLVAGRPAPAATHRPGRGHPRRGGPQALTPPHQGGGPPAVESLQQTPRRAGRSYAAPAREIARHATLRTAQELRYCGAVATGERERAGLRERKKRETRIALSWAAVRLVVERGLDDVRVEDIAAEVGVSPRTFNNYFSSKGEAIAARHLDRAREIAEELRAQPACVPLWEAITAAALARFALGPRTPARTTGPTGSGSRGSA